ncbi:MAG: phenylacetate--CoA ligase, partial [Coriobacteriia bacterium]|nr:phenylacetate--CoA ligase [Coriobacteriia bacterium]
MPIWNPEYETMSRDKLGELQLRRLQATVAWVYDNVPYYKRVMDERGARPRDVKSLEDLRKLPLTDKTALRDTYPFGLFAVPLDDVVRIHSSSGTTGKPIVVGYTRGDIATWTELTARVASAAGVVHTDLAQMAFGYGMFTGGFGMHYGLERVGATVIPASAGNTERHIMMMQDFGTTVLVSTPSYALYMGEVAESMGVDFSVLPLRLGLFGAEPCLEAARKEIQEKLRIVAT